MRKAIFAVASSAIIVAGLGGQAATITTSNGTATCFEVGSTTVAAACSGYLFGAGGPNATAGILDGATADIWDIATVTGSGANSEANEAIFLSAVTGLTFATADVSKTSGNSGDMTFLFDSEFVAIKIGAGHLVLKNDAGTAIDVAWDGAQAGGLSHFTVGGDLPAIPLPAAGGMTLLALGALGLLRRSRRSTAA